jgi:hypothetical protein
MSLQTFGACLSNGFRCLRRESIDRNQREHGNPGLRCERKRQVANIARNNAEAKGTGGATGSCVETSKVARNGNLGNLSIPERVQKLQTANLDAMLDRAQAWRTVVSALRA